MTPKEKAEELFGKFADIEHLGVYGDYNGTWEWSSSLWRKQAKESALIAIDEIINCDCFFKTLEDTKAFTKYWYEVKHEIEKL
jgi:hypothetical protein